MTGFAPAYAADVLLVERPAALVVYNAYQQQASDADRRLLVPFVPMQVMNHHVVMSDGFTVCMKVELHGAIFFLLTEGGTLAGKGYGATRLIRLAVLLGDTVHLVAGHSLAAEPPLGGTARRYSGGTSLIRLFRSGDRTFVRPLNDNAGFGWVVLREDERGRIWDRVKHIVAAESGIPDRLTNGVREALNNANRALESLYAELSRESGRQLAPPVWHLEVEADQLTCLLEGASSSGFQRTTEQLARSLENLMLGSGYEVSVGEGRIGIGKR